MEKVQFHNRLIIYTQDNTEWESAAILGTFCRSSITSLLSGLEAAEISPSMENIQQKSQLQIPQSGNSRSPTRTSPGTGLKDPADVLLCIQMYLGTKQV